MITKDSIRTSILAAVPVLLFGISWLSEYTDIHRIYQVALFICAIASMFLLFGIGWVKNFPEWSIYSIGFCLLISLMLINISSPTLNRSETFGLLRLLPLGLTLIISLSINFSLQPLRRLFKQIKEEKGAIIFIFYGMLPLLLWIEFDEIRQVSVIPYVIILTILTALGVILYLTGTNKYVKTLSLVLGIAITNAVAIAAITMVFD